MSALTLPSRVGLTRENYFYKNFKKLKLLLIGTTKALPEHSDPLSEYKLESDSSERKCYQNEHHYLLAGLEKVNTVISH